MTDTEAEVKAAALNIVEACIMWGISLQKLSDEDLQRFKADALLCAQAVMRSKP